MNHPDISRDPPRDPEVGAWLAGREVAPEGEDRAGLHAAIMAAAQLPLARLRLQLQPQWWEYMARWARPAVPLAVAAGVALTFLVGSLPEPAEMSRAPMAAASLPMLEDVLTSSVPEAEYNLLVAGQGDTDALLSFTMHEVR